MSDAAYRIIQTDDRTWIIENGGVRLFLLAGDRQAAVIDTGMTMRDLRSLIARLTDLPVILINTHADPDHISCNAEFGVAHMHPEEEPNYRSRGGRGPVMPLQEGDVIDLGDRPLEIIWIPGHTPGSIAVLDVRTRTLISGDPIQRGTIYMCGSFRDMDRYMDSLDHLESFSGRFDHLWPSHGELPLEPGIIDVMRDYGRRMLSGQAVGHPVDLRGGQVMKYDFPQAAFLRDMPAEQ